MFSQKMFDEDDDEEQMKNEVMLNKITMENLELKGYIEKPKGLFFKIFLKIFLHITLSHLIQKVFQRQANQATRDSWTQYVS